MMKPTTENFIDTEEPLNDIERAGQHDSQPQSPELHYMAREHGRSPSGSLAAALR